LANITYHMLSTSHVTQQCATVHLCSLQLNQQVMQSQTCSGY